MRSAGFQALHFRFSTNGSQSYALCFNLFSRKTSKRSFGGIEAPTFGLALSPALRIAIVGGSFFFYFNE